MKRFVVMFAFLLLAACAQLGLQPAKSFDQQLGYSYSAVTAIRTSTAQALTSNSIKVDDAKHVQELADQARTLLDESRTLNFAGYTSTALGKLNLATSILTQLQTYLNTKGAK